MKKLLLLALLMGVLFPIGATAKIKPDETGTPAIEFSEISHDFGTVKSDGGVLVYSFPFTNIGTAPLSIITVSASCGCTKPEFDPKPLDPGESSKITIRFNPEDFKGEFTKTAIVRTNIKGKDGRVSLTISGVVIPKSKK